jgi:hypothetical protein
MLKTATVILVIAMLFSGLYSLLLVVSPQTVAESTLQARAGVGFEGVPEKAVAGTIVAQTRHMGIFALTTTIAMFFVLFAGFAKGQKWAWWAFFFTGGISWIYGLTVQIAEGDTPNMIGHLIGIALWLIGILLPLNAFFAKKNA